MEKMCLSLIRKQFLKSCSQAVKPSSQNSPWQNRDCSCILTVGFISSVPPCLQRRPAPRVGPAPSTQPGVLCPLLLPANSRSRLRPRPLTPACTSRCVRLLREQWLRSQATSARLLLHTDTAWTDSAALSLWRVASVRFSPAGKKKGLYEMPWTPNQLSSVLTSFLTSFTSCLYPLPTYLPLCSTSLRPRLLLQHPDQKTPVHEFLHSFLCEDEITGFPFGVEYMIKGQARDEDSFFPKINFLCSREREPPSRTHLGGKLPRLHSKFQNQRTAK